VQRKTDGSIVFLTCEGQRNAQRTRSWWWKEGRISATNAILRVRVVMRYRMGGVLVERMLLGAEGILAARPAGTPLLAEALRYLRRASRGPQRSSPFCGPAHKYLSKMFKDSGCDQG